MYSKEDWKNNHSFAKWTGNFFVREIKPSEDQKILNKLTCT